MLGEALAKGQGFGLKSFTNMCQSLRKTGRSSGNDLMAELENFRHSREPQQ